MANYIYVPGLSEKVEQEIAEQKKNESQNENTFITVTGAKKKKKMRKDGEKIMSHKDDDRSITIPPNNKYALTIKEAAVYYNIAESRLNEYIQNNKTAPFVLKAGSRLLIKRVMFEKILNMISSI